MKTKNSVLLAAVAVVALGSLALAQAPPADKPAEKPGHHHENLTGPAKERHEAMEQVGDAIKVLAAMAKGQRKFDPAVVKAEATTIEERLEKASTLFPAGSDQGETHARPEIWSDRAGFDKGMKDAEQAAHALQSVSEETAFRPALGALGRSCKECHDKYRMADEH